MAKSWFRQVVFLAVAASAQDLPVARIVKELGVEGLCDNVINGEVEGRAAVRALRLFESCDPCVEDLSVVAPGGEAHLVRH